ncbi:MAG: transglutaminase-like domain-containing protein [Gemmatimonadota bacterium]
MTGRGLLALGILGAWGVGIAVYAQRELSRSPRAKLAEIAARVGPGATYFAVEAGGRHVGFASSTIDTIPSALQVTDYFVADLPIRGVKQRTTAQSVVKLSRALALREFTVSFGSDSQAMRATGRTVGDTLLEYVVSRAGRAGDTSRVRLSAPLLLPTLVPLVVALGDPPSVGRRYRMDIFDPVALQLRSLSLRVAAESLFVVVDSAAFSEDAKRWLGAHADTVRAVHVVADSGGNFDSWIDEQGRIIAVRTIAGLSMRRTAYEVAFENWRTGSARRVGHDPHTMEMSDEPRGTGPRSESVPTGWRQLDTLRIRIVGTELMRFAANGGTQQVHGDSIFIIRDGVAALRPSFPLPPGRAVRQQFGRELRAEPLLEVDHPDVAAMARRLKGRDAMADVVARRIAAWVHDSMAAGSGAALPSALATLRARQGDVEERAQLFVALARAAGIPARTVSGLLSIDGRFAYHAWGEVLLQHWVGVDPAFDQFPTDASHVRLLVSGLALQPELARLIGRVHIDVLSGTVAQTRDD